LVAAAILIGGSFMAMRLGRVDASDVGVLINNLTGTVTVQMEPGSFFYNGWTTDLHTIDKTLHTLRMRSENGEEVRIKTIDGTDVTLDVEVNYRLLLDEQTIKGKIVPEAGVGHYSDDSLHTSSRRGPRVAGLVEAYQAKWIRDYSRSVIRYVFGTLTAEEFYNNATKRDEKARDAEKELNRLLHPHGVDVVKVVPDRFRFYEEYETKIREKKEADQEKEQQLEMAKTAVENQKRQEVEATKTAEVEIENIKGVLQKAKITAEGEAIKLVKEGEAYAYKTKVDADAEFYQAEREAKGILASATAEAEGLTNLVKALSGEGGRNLVLRALADSLRQATIEGIPYSTSSVVQKVAVEGLVPAAGATSKEGR
jgi:hypothetical protein